MRIPVIEGVIQRRILANFRVDPQVMARLLPAPFRPLQVNGAAIAGICLIRLGDVRPRFLPRGCGIRSENAAHRVAVEWDDAGQTRQGVYIPRRDTDSRLNAWAGGTIFPGLHHLARFQVEETADRLSVAIESHDHLVQLKVVAQVAERLPASSLFQDVAQASAFFEQGSLGYSPRRQPGRYDGLELRCRNWQVQPLAVETIESSYFADETAFPPGSVEFDHALLMRGIQHQWHSHQELCCPATADA